MTRTMLAAPRQIITCDACGGTGQDSQDPDHDCRACDGFGTLVRTINEDGVVWVESHAEADAPEETWPLTTQVDTSDLPLPF